MRFALSTSAKLPFGLERRLSMNYTRRDLPCHSFSGRPRSLHKLVSTICSIKATAGEHVDYPIKLSSYLHNLTSQILEASPEAIKEFPWMKAKLMVEERLIVLGKNALTYSLVALLIFSFVSDVLTAFFVRRELVVPLGLFVGILLAEFFKESCMELFQSKTKNGKEMQQLWGIGVFFVALRFIFLSLRIPGWVLFSHIGNGGLMQILWLAKETKQPEIIQEMEEVDALQSNLQEAERIS